MLQNHVKSLDQVDENCRLLAQQNAEIEQEKMCLNEEMVKLSSGYNTLLYREGELSTAFKKSNNMVLQLRMELGAAKERIKRIQEENMHLQMTIEGLQHDDLVY
ncbi:hypothetical protein ACJMK2_033210 [Sinanodonta woodiana]|uniref:Uncharacterized protein n=1 Tax=Sinanodonta woodiana TaxID=1069815 RepID=A0ABD3X438_SINWO